MEWVTELIRWALGLGRGFAAPFLLFLIFGIFRLFRLNRKLLEARPAQDLAYELELLRRLAKDPPTTIAGILAFAWFLAYELAVYPRRLVILNLQDLFHLYFAPYGLPLLALLVASLLSKKWKTLLLSAVPVALVGAFWIYAYNRWVHPIPPVPPDKVGIWVVPSAGQEGDREYLDFFQELSNTSKNLAAYVGRTPGAAVSPASLEEQAGQCQRLALKFGSRAVVWVVVGKKQTFLYATFNYLQTPERWEFPWGDWVNLTGLRDRPEETIQFLLGAAYMYEGRYQDAIKHLDAIPQSELPPALAYFLAYSRLQAAQAGDTGELGNLLGYLPDFVRKSTDPYDEAQASFLLGIAYSDAVGIAQSDQFFNQHPEFQLQTRDQALERAEGAFRVALAKLPESFLIEQGRVRLALGRALADADWGVGDLEGRSRRAQTQLESAQISLNTTDTRVEFGLASQYLGVAWYNTAYFASGDSERYMCSMAISALTAALQVFPEERYPKLYGRLQDDLGSTYTALSNVEPETSVVRAVGAFRKERELGRRMGGQQMVFYADYGICIVANVSDSPDVLQDGEKSCEAVRPALRGNDLFGYAVATRGLGEIMWKMSQTKLPLPGVDRWALLRQARAAFREALAALGPLAQKPYVRVMRDWINADLQDVEAELTARQ